MSILLGQERAAVAKTALDLLRSGLVVNTSGNVSMRVGEYVVITPGGRSYEKLKRADVAVLDLEGEPVDGDLAPSSETPLHLSMYASDPNIKAIVHTHSVYATALSTVRKELPAVHYQIADLGGAVPVAPYRTFGTLELAEAVTAAMRGRSAVLMQNHGAVTIGSTVAQALARSVTLEWLARVYLIAAQSGDPVILADDELSRVRQQQQKFRAAQQ